MAQVKLTLEINKDDNGTLKTSHYLQTQEDADKVLEWKDGGLLHITHALFVESLKRECYTMMLSLLSEGKVPDEITAQDLSEKTIKHMADMLGKYSLKMCEKTLDLYKDQFPDLEGESSEEESSEEYTSDEEYTSEEESSES